MSTNKMQAEARIELVPQAPETLDWLRYALRHPAHGFELRHPIAHTPDDLGKMLEQWEAAGWIKRGHFDPDLSQRALAIVHPSRKATMANAREVLERELAAGVDGRRTSFWWEPGPKAAEAMALLPPPPPGLQIGEVVRYRRGFLRSIGCTNDAEMLAWHGAVRSIRELGSGTKIVRVDCDPEACTCADDDAGCLRCGGPGVARYKAINAKNLERVRT